MSILARRDAKAWSGAAIVIGAAGLLYVLTAARDIVVSDTPELIAAAVTLGVPHPPGFPLFTMLGHLFSLLPLGPVPFRVNLLASTCDALTVGVVYLTALRLSRNGLAAAVAALALAVSPIFWSWSLVTDVFALNNLLASLMIYLLMAWRDRPERRALLVAVFFAAGLALTNHPTIVLLGPAFGFVLWQGRPSWWRPQTLFICIAAFLIGLLPYAYVLWAAARHPLVNWGSVSSLGDLFGLITRKSYGATRLVAVTEVMGGSALDRLLALFISFGALMGPLILLGLIYAYKHQRYYFWFSLLAFACTGPLFVSIANLNLAAATIALYVLERFFILSHVVLAPLIALGIVTIAEFIAFRWSKLPIPPLRFVAGAGLVALVIAVWANYHAVDQSRNHLARFYAEDIFGTVEPDTILLANGDDIVLPLIYLQSVEGVRKDVTVLVMPLLPAEWYLRQIRERYPHLTVPFDHYDGRLNGLKALIDANKEHTIAVAGNVPKSDTSLKGSYWFYQHGLVNILEPVGKEIGLRQAANENDQLLNRYRLPAAHAIKARSPESNILFAYAAPALRLGKAYEQVGSKQEAVIWYERALTIDPNLPQAREALARVRQ